MDEHPYIATFAAGCFWGVEKVFRDLPGVTATAVGYTGGTKPNPTYEEVCTGQTGHAEAVRVTYDPSLLSYEDLLKVFWESHDPTQKDRQGPDIGSQYRSVIFYHTDRQKYLAEQSLYREQVKHTNVIVTEVLPAGEWYRAEEYHQQYLARQGGATVC